MTAAGQAVAATTAPFLRAIDLTATGEHTFTSVPQDVPWPKAYGGDLIAPALAAAVRTVGDDRQVHSTHSYFLRPVAIGEVVEHEVDVLRDGRSFSTRQVRTFQAGKLVYTAMVSFHTGETSQVDVSVEAPEVPAPESLPSAAEALAGVDTGAAVYWSAGRSFDHRHVPGALYLTGDADRRPHQAVWVRAYEVLPDDSLTHLLALAYVCDYTILEPVLRAQGHWWAEPGLMTASLDHALWFHRPARADEWLLYAQEAQSASDGRGVALGRFFNRDGAHVATVVQEGLVRPTAGGASS